MTDTPVSSSLTALIWSLYACPVIFRRRIFLVILAVGLLPALTILAVSAIILNSTINRLGAAGLERSLQSASRLVDDTEAALASQMDAFLKRSVPWQDDRRLRELMKQNNIDLIFETRDGRVVRLLADSSKFDTSLTKSLPVNPGLSYVSSDEKFLMIFSIEDSSRLYGCGVLMPSDYEMAGRDLAEAISVSASLGIYKSFSLQLLAVITAIIVAVVLILGFLLSTFLSGRLVKPLAELTEGARKIGGGDLNFRVELPGDDEFSRLGNSFNRMAGEIRENQKKLLEAERLAAWREVARRIAHEIRNPLTPISIELFRLRQKSADSGKSSPDEIAACIDTIQKQIQALQDLASQFSIFAKEPELKRIKCNIRSIINDAVLLYHGYENLKIDIDIAENIPELELDPAMMVRLFSNLIKNSIEASPKGATIKIKLKRQDDSVWVRFSDDGPGFPAEKLARIDQPYITTKGKGTGLGMAIVKKIAEEHGGTIRFYNDNGAVVEFSLPIG